MLELEMEGPVYQIQKCTVHMCCTNLDWMSSVLVYQRPD